MRQHPSNPRRHRLHVCSRCGSKEHWAGIGGTECPAPDDTDPTAEHKYGPLGIPLEEERRRAKADEKYGTG